jgi:integrase
LGTGSDPERLREAAFRHSRYSLCVPQRGAILIVGQRLAPSTVKGIVLTTGQVFAQAMDDGMIARSPFAKVKLPEDREHDEMHFLDAEPDRLAAAIDDRYRAAIYLAVYGGLRAGELWALQTDRLNVLARTVDISSR